MHFLTWSDNVIWLSILIEICIIEFNFHEVNTMLLKLKPNRLFYNAVKGNYGDIVIDLSLIFRE